MPQSFPGKLGSDAPKSPLPEFVYRGTGLSPYQLKQQGGLRAWGTDMDLHFHTSETQEERRHSGYVATSKNFLVSEKFGGDE